MHCLRAVSTLYVIITTGILFVSGQRCKTSSECPEFAYCFMKVCNCNNGFFKQDGQCVDINDCEVRNTCSINAVCENHPGGHSCGCREGYMGNGRECIDVDECNDIGNVCNPIETCQNEQGSYKCYCNGKVCHKQAYCLDDRGRVGCVCNIGFAGDGQYCQDIDECLERTDNCTKKEKCVNTLGGFTCNTAILRLKLDAMFFVIIILISHCLLYN